MKRLTTSIVLLLLVLAVCIGCRWKLGALSDQLSAQVESFSSLAEQNHLQSAWETLEEAQEVWLSNRPFLGAILPHDELDEIERLFATSIQAARNQDLPECRMRAAELKALLRHLPEREAPSVQNIF